MRSLLHSADAQPLKNVEKVATKTRNTEEEMYKTEESETA